MLAFARFLNPDALKALTIVAVAAAAVALGAILALLFRDAVRDATNAEWRERITTTSAAVRSAIDKGSAEAAATDEDVIKALGETDAKLKAAEDRLADAAEIARRSRLGAMPDSAATPGAAQCPRIPARCIGLR